MHIPTLSVSDSDTAVNMVRLIFVGMKLSVREQIQTFLNSIQS